MASVYPSHIDSSPQSPRIQRVPEAQHRRALSLLFTGRLDPDHTSVDQFLNFIQQQNISLDDLWAAFSGDTPQAVCFVFPSAGRTGMCFISPVKGPSAIDLTAQVIRAAIAAQDRREIALFQSLLDLGETLEKRSLAAAGFNELATLCYMQRDADLPDRPLNLGDPDIQVLHYNPQTHDRFAQAILASYHDTLDCPGLVGLRHIGDIISGHKAAGEFDPGLWHAFYRGGEPVGVMLLADLPQRSSVELVYLGLAPAFRGQGLAKRMLHHGLVVASKRPFNIHRGITTMCLAVDERNAPAMRLYRSLGFRLTARKLAMIESLQR